jgi:membrane protein YdbS with pleckstrin-like domain
MDDILILLPTIIGIGGGLIITFVSLMQGAKRDTTFVSHLRRGFLAVIITVLLLAFIFAVCTWFFAFSPDASGIPGMTLMLVGIPVNMCVVVMILLVVSARVKYDKGKPSMLLKRVPYR